MHLKSYNWNKWVIELNEKLNRELELNREIFYRLVGCLKIFMKF